MTENIYHSKENCAHWLRAGALLVAAAGLLGAQTSSAPSNNYLVHNLVSDLANLVNP